MRRWDVIADLVRRYKLRLGAEIGVAEGRFSAGLLALCPEVKLWCVDDYAPGYKTWMGTTWGAGQQAANQRKAYDVALRFPGRMTPLDMTSAHAAEWLAGAQLDFVFIDADHSYEAVRKDIEAWRKLVRPGGWLTGHDYDEVKFPGVVKAVDEAFGGLDAELMIGDDFTWMVQLPKSSRSNSLSISITSDLQAA